MSEEVIGERVLHLGDGRTVLVRDLTVADEAALRQAYTSADPAILRSRFGGAVPKLSLLVDRLHQMDGITRYGAGAFADNGELVGVAQYVQPVPGDPADVAVVVAADWQRQGIGTALLHLAGEHAARAGIGTATALVSWSNARVLELIADLPVQHTVQYERGSGTLRADLTPLAGAVLPPLSEVARAADAGGSTTAPTAAGDPHDQPERPSSSGRRGSTCSTADARQER
jgi:GNAT superfamily N-acetyltransferase